MEVTLAICMYNAERYLEETLQSVMAQTMQEFHLLIIDDCSTDSSVRVVKRFFSENPREYELVVQKENTGTASVRNVALTRALTKYLVFVDADDCPYPTLVEKLYDKIISDGDLAAVGCHLEYMDCRGKRLLGGIFLGETTKEDFYAKAAKEKLIFMQPTAIYDRAVMLQAGGFAVDGFPSGKPRYQDFCEDVDLWTRVSDFYVEGKAIVVLPEVLCRYRKHESSMSSNTMAMFLRMRHVKANLKRRRQGEPELSFIDFQNQMPEREYRKLKREVLAVDSARSGWTFLRSGNFFAALRCFVISICANPECLVCKFRFNILKHK